LPPEKRNGVAYFLYCIRNDKPLEGPVAASLNVAVNEIIDAAKESIRTGRAVELKRESLRTTWVSAGVCCQEVRPARFATSLSRRRSPAEHASRQR
jgi:hypothetical protein